MSLDMADRMVVIGISANSMTARAETDRKKEHLSPESSFHPDGNKAKASLSALSPQSLWPWPGSYSPQSGPDAGSLALLERVSLVQLPFLPRALLTSQIQGG